MFRITILALPVVALLCPATSASATDFPGGGWHPDERDMRHRHARHGSIGHHLDAGPHGRTPEFFAGAGEAAPWGGRVTLVEYREAYLPRGVLYNVPGPPVFVRETIVRAKY